MNPAHTPLDTVDEIAARWLQAKSERSLTDHEAEELALWLTQSELHAQRYERLARAWASPAVWTALATLADEERRAAPPRRRGRAAWAGLGIAATAAMVALLVITRPDAKTPLVADYETGSAEIRTITLADGSRLHLNGETAVSLRFDRAARRIDLAHGEFSIEVASESRPLEVWADGAVVTAVGTAFNVDRRREGLAVLVTEGVVEVARGTWTPVRVPAGKAARITAAGVAVTDPDPLSAAWRDGALATSGVSIGDLAHALSRYTDREIVVPPQIADEVVSGRFSLTQPDRTLRLLAAAYDFDVREEPTRFVLSPSGP